MCSFNKEIAECVGLWLAEGWNKYSNKREITFTNSCVDLLILFDKTLKKIFKDQKLNIRVYIYSKNGDVRNLPIRGVIYKNYRDIRARKPYYIWRLGSTILTKRWRSIINKTLKDEKLQIAILRGFFAGEGYIKLTKRNKQLQISQAKRVEFIEEVLKRLNISYDYDSNHRRGYIIYRRSNWDKLAKLKIADLHPDKKRKFWEAYNDYKEYHYNKGFLKQEIIKVLNKPYTSKGLALKFNRSQDRVYDILGKLKKEGLMKNYRVKNIDYWIKVNEHKIIISHVKAHYLRLIREGHKRTKTISRKVNKCEKSVRNRLIELERLGLLNRNSNKEWCIRNNNNEVVTI